MTISTKRSFQLLAVFISFVTKIFAETERISGIQSLIYRLLRHNPWLCKKSLSLYIWMRFLNKLFDPFIQYLLAQRTENYAYVSET